MEISQENGTEAGRLIKEALADLTRRKKLTQRGAAAKAGISEAWWRQVVNGGQHRSGVWVPAVGSVATYTRMAAAVGIPADRILDVLGVPEDERQTSARADELDSYVAEPGPTADSEEEGDVLARITARLEQMEHDIADMKRRAGS